MPDERVIAVFGDTHGHLRLLFRLCSEWQVRHREHLSGILQCGDLGYFPNPDNLDKATRRYAALGGGTEPASVPEDDHGLGEPWKWVNGRACEAQLDESFHVLLSHTSPRGIGGESNAWGSDRLRRVVDACRPLYHFYAHHRNPIPPARAGDTRCFWLNDVNLTRDPESGEVAPEKGCMGILRWSDEENHSFEIVNDLRPDSVFVPSEVVVRLDAEGGTTREKPRESRGAAREPAERSSLWMAFQ